MPDIVLYDRVGAPVTYRGADGITVDTPTAGETAKFTYGELAEGVEIAPDFSGGDQKISVPEGYLVREATIKKPDNLDPAIIAHGEYVAGVGPGTYVGKGAEKTVELDFCDYQKIDTADGMATILTDGNNLGQVYQYIGDTGEYINGQFYKVVNGQELFDPQKCYGTAVEVNSATQLTATINCNVGDLIVAAFAIRSSLVSVSDGWTLISSSKSVHEINATAQTSYYQTLSFAYKYATSTSESITVTQETAGRIYINMVSIDGATGIVDMGYQYQNNASATSKNVATFTRPEGKVVLWGVTCYLWSTSTPYREWSLSNDSVKIQLGTSTQSRLLLAIDTSNDSTVTFTSGGTTSASQDAIICGALSIEFPQYVFKPVDASEAPVKDSVIVEPDPGTLLSKVFMMKPEGLASKNILFGRVVAGIAGSGAKFASGITSGGNGVINIEHGLGVVPDFAIILSTYSAGSSWKSTSYGGMYIASGVCGNATPIISYHYVNSSGYYAVASGTSVTSFAVDDKNMVLKNTPKNTQKTYYWLAIANLN